MGNLYDQDFYAWTKAQAEALKRGDFSQADVKNIIEEIETMGRGEKRELLSRLEVLLTHLLTWNNQFLLRSKSWVLAIDEQRHQLKQVLEESPSLVPMLDDAIERAYKRARVVASRETGIHLKSFPLVCPFKIDQILDENWLPDEAGSPRWTPGA